jgi:hypothetical protein
MYRSLVCRRSIYRDLIWNVCRALTDQPWGPDQTVLSSRWDEVSISEMDCSSGSTPKHLSTNYPARCNESIKVTMRYRLKATKREIRRTVYHAWQTVCQCIEIVLFFILWVLISVVWVYHGQELVQGCSMLWFLGVHLTKWMYLVCKSERF